MDAGFRPTGYQSFKHLLRRKSNLFGSMDTAEIVFTKVIPCFSAGNAGLLDLPYRVCF